MLRFVAPEMELAYQEEMLDSGVHARARRVLVLGGIGLLWCMNFGFGLSDMQWVARGATLCIAAFYAGYALVLRRNPYFVGFNHGRVMLASYCYAAIIAAMTRDRWAKLIQSEDIYINCLPTLSGVQDGKCRATGLMEASCILSLSGLLNLSAFFTQLPTFHCFLLLNFVVVAYIGLAWGLGSLEHQLLGTILEDTWENNRILHHSVVAAGLYTLGILTLTSRRALEVKDRRAFASAYLKLAKREWEAREDLKAVARQNELEQRLHALMTPMGSMDELYPGSHNNTEDSAQPHNHHLTPSEASCSSGVERLRSARLQQQATLSRSDKNTDSAPHSSSDGTQESGKSKSRKMLGPPNLQRRSWKSKDSAHEEAPWLKTVPPPPIWCVTHNSAGDEAKLEPIDAASVDSTAATPPHPAAIPVSVSASSPSSPSASQLTTGPLGSAPGRNRLSALSTNEVFSKRRSSQASGPAQAKPPNTRLVTQMAGHTADWPRIRRMAQRIKQTDYSLHMYFQDCVRAFPELTLFTCGEHAETGRMTASGRSAEVEYQRTIGALFAVYWLLRLDIDGKEAFCYGVDDDWNVRSPPQEAKSPTDGEHSMMPGSMVRSGSMDQVRKNMTGSSEVHAPVRKSTTGSAELRSWRRRSNTSATSEPPPPAKKLFSQMTAEEKRLSFMTNTAWSQFQELVNQAGCSDDNPDRIDNIMAMLCLTSFHDIMKVEELLPIVQHDHAPYHGYEAGITIQDHDAALSYVLEHFPEVLPSFGGLPAAAKELVIFSQGKMHFNHGWFVQAEAPPGIMLSKFKQVLSNGASPRHVGFYFFHWITDLAGAEATPLGGGEKFVLKFPHDVLASFLWSMPFLGKLVDMTETAVVESYLKERWRMLNPEIPLPTGNSAIARMRLAVMVQEVESTLQAFDELSSMEMTVLSEELARTGVKEQYYSEDCKKLGGPAFLVYYGPALMQQNCSSLEDLTLAMMILSRVLIAARRLWPLQQKDEAKAVTIQVSELKSRSLLDITGSPSADVRQVWVLIRQNDNDGTVMLRQAVDLNYLFNNGQQFVVLDFSSRTHFAIEGEHKRSGSIETIAERPEKKTVVAVHGAPVKVAEPSAGQEGSPRAKEDGSGGPAKQQEDAGRRNSIGRNSTESANTYEFMHCVPSHQNSMMPEVHQVASQSKDVT